jgi:hypothetical protein
MTSNQIPNDIMRRAQKLDRTLEQNLLNDGNGPYISVAGVEEIARALMEAEARGYSRAKEQAVKVASGFYEDTPGYLDRGERQAFSGSLWASERIATAIRAMKDKRDV